MKSSWTMLLWLSVVVFQPASAQVFDEDYVNGSDTVRVDAQLGLQSDRMHRGQNLYNGTSVQPQAKIAIPIGAGSIYARLFAHIPADQGGTKRGAAFVVPDPAPDEDEDEQGEGDEAEGDSDEGAEDEEEQEEDLDDSEIEVARVTPSFTEIDYTIGYEVDFDLFVLDVGNTWYNYNKTTGRLRDTAEVHATVDFKVFTHPYVTAAYEYDERTGWYYEVGFRQPIPLGLSDERDALIPFVKLGLNHGLSDGEHPIYEDDGLAFVDAGLHAQFYISDDLRIQPEVHYNEAIDDFADSEFSFGMNLVGEFGH